MNISSGPVALRNAEAGDAAQLADWWNDGGVMAHAGFPLGLGTTAEAVRQDLERDRDDRGRRLILEYERRPIGEMNYRLLGQDTAEIGIKICETAFLEKGIGRRALSLLIRELFRRGCRRILLDTNLNNTRAQHVYEKLGFRRTGIRRNSWHDQLGKAQSAVDYELTEKDFVDYSE